MERDAEWAIKLKDRARPDIQNARRMIGEGEGWISRLKSALACGELAALMNVPPRRGVCGSKYLKNFIGRTLLLCIRRTTQIQATVAKSGVPQG